jgi:hypothetical protein
VFQYQFLSKMHEMSINFQRSVIYVHQACDLRASLHGKGKRGQDMELAAPSPEDDSGDKFCSTSKDRATPSSSLPPRASMTSTSYIGLPYFGIKIVSLAPKIHYTGWNSQEAHTSHDREQDALVIVHAR